MRSDLLTPPFRRAFLANFFSDLAFTMFIQFPGFLAELGAREALIGTVMSVAVLASILSRPLVGEGLDRIGRVPMVTAAAAIRVVTVLSFLLVHSIGPAVFVARAVYAIVLAVTFTGLFTYASDVIPPGRRTQGIAIYGLSGMLPGMFGPALGDLIIGVGGYRAFFVAVAAIDLALLAITRTLRPLPEAPSLAGRVSFLRFVRRRELAPVWILTLVFGLAFGSIITFLRTYVDTVGFGTVGLFMFAYSGTAVTLRLTVSWLPDRVGYRRIIPLAIGFIVAGFTLLAFAGGVGTLVLAAALGGAGHAFLFPILARLTVDRSPGANRGAGMGIFTAMFDLAILIGGPSLGLLIEAKGYGWTFATVAALAAVGGALFFLTDRERTASPPVRPVA